MPPPINGIDDKEAKSIFLKRLNVLDTSSYDDLDFEATVRKVLGETRVGLQTLSKEVFGPSSGQTIGSRFENGRQFTAQDAQNMADGILKIHRSKTNKAKNERTAEKGEVAKEIFFKALGVKEVPKRFEDMTYQETAKEVANAVGIRSPWAATKRAYEDKKMPIGKISAFRESHQLDPKNVKILAQYLKPYLQEAKRRKFVTSDLTVDSKREERAIEKLAEDILFGAVGIPKPERKRFSGQAIGLIGRAIRNEAGLTGNPGAESIARRMGLRPSTYKEFEAHTANEVNGARLSRIGGTLFEAVEGRLEKWGSVLRRVLIDSDSELGKKLQDPEIPQMREVSQTERSLSLGKSVPNRSII